MAQQTASTEGSPQDGALVDEAYSAALFSELSDVWRQALSGHLQHMLSGDSAVLNWQDPAQAVVVAENFLTAADSTVSAQDRKLRFGQLLQQMLAHGQNLHNPRYIGHQVPASVPIAGLFDAVGSVTNQPMAIYEMGPWASAVEHALVRQLCLRIGWDADQSSGLLTHGGSLANLTALLTARNVVFPDSWENGPPQNAVLVVHAEAHYCITRAAGILGLGTRQIRKVALDSKRRMDPRALDEVLSSCRAQGEQVLAVTAAACATPIGAFDPLSEVADVCRNHGVWLHVDAAHGGGVLMSNRHRHLLDGIHLADSVVWDAHKMLFMPALCAAVLYSNKQHRFAAFQQEAPYLYDASNPGMAEYDNGMRTVECTKRSTGFGLWGLWSMYGDTIFAELVDRTFQLAACAHQLLSSADDFETCHVPEGNIVVFRYVPDALKAADTSVLNPFQQQLRSQLVRSGQFYIVQTKLDGCQYLRLTVMNPMTTAADLQALLDSIRKTGSSILQMRGGSC